MNDEEVRKSLVAGGVPTDDLEAPPSNQIGSFSSLSDPQGAEVLGRDMAEALRVHRPSLVVVWEDIENNVLAYIVARELGLSVVRVIDASGVLDYEGAFGSDDRVVIVADAFRNGFSINAMRALTEQHGARLVAFGALMSTPALLDAAGETAMTTMWPSAGQETPTS